MRRQCARPGCSVVASATFTFDSEKQTVWLDAPFEGNARAGDLCARHARVLSPPRGWNLIDRRGPAPVERPKPAPLVTPASSAPAAASTPRRPTPQPATVQPRLEAAAPVARPSWHPRFERGDSLDGVLEATTPLLA